LLQRVTQGLHLLGQSGRSSVRAGACGGSSGFRGGQGQGGLLLARRLVGGAQVADVAGLFLAGALVVEAHEAREKLGLGQGGGLGVGIG
jgi:hypothetical protein